MERLNFDHMGERSPTDVLAFPLHEWSIDGRHSHLADDDGVSPPGATLLGDVVINVDQAVRQASAGDWSVAEEIVLLAIHGTLHLLGHDHAEMDEEQAMRSAGARRAGRPPSAPSGRRLEAGLPLRPRRARRHHRQLSRRGFRCGRASSGSGGPGLPRMVTCQVVVSLPPPTV